MEDIIRSLKLRGLHAEAQMLDVIISESKKKLKEGKRGGTYYLNKKGKKVYTKDGSGLPTYKAKKLINSVASDAHEQWRSAYKAANGDKPRIKRTKDAKWISKHGGKDEVDIANTKYGDLPSEWQKENKESARAVVHAIKKHLDEGGKLDSTFVEKVADHVHKKWLERNKDWAPENQKLPYNQLSEDEKEKDRVFVKRAIQLME